MTTDTLILGDFNAHHSSWYSSSTDTRGTMLESMVSGSNFGILNWDSPTRLPGNANPGYPDVSLASASLITSTKWQTKTTQPTSGGAVTADSSCCAICVERPHPQQWGPDLPFFGHAGHADPLDGWRCCSQKRVMSRPIQVRQL